ncbi:membrane integrity-associated transporter subunit PqiC [Frateuria sp. MAH-13]|uniref:Membrane integrity-associated transporter subunit PqiC n=1 Tax=Frateuria flava TaxID=2821489 RepID=A0ABS4DQ27_9GAMM|nr:PqiC family protein [Frateuria flava]MBP1475048.1 membrane integrity-associated transporter subunit PqiC [Frateuria flava]
MIRTRFLLAAALALGLAACASEPARYYTLLAPAPAEAGTASPAPFNFELMPVGIPAQVDQPQLVIRQGGQGVAPLSGQRWIAPLADEVRAALSADLAKALHAQDATGLPSGGKPRLRIKVDLRRFDSAPGDYALVDAAWSVRQLQGDAMLACTSQFREPVGAGYDALVEGHQRALARLAGAIAQVAGPVAAGQSPACP